MKDYITLGRVLAGNMTENRGYKMKGRQGRGLAGSYVSVQLTGRGYETIAGSIYDRETG